MSRLLRLPFGMRYLLHTQGILGSSFALFLYLYVHIFNFFPIIIPRYHDGSLPTLIVIVYMFLSANTIISFFRTMLSDPGRVLKLSDEKIDWTFWEKCPKCVKPRPPRSHHCQKCGHCVLKMDHHCMWTNNCIGAGNSWIFITLLCYTFAFAVLNTVIYLLHVFKWLEECSACNQIPWINSTSPSIRYLSYFFILLMNLATLFLLLTQYINVYYDKTTIENMSESNTILAVQRFRDSKSKHHSFASLCGTSRILWLFPCRIRSYPITNSIGLGASHPFAV
ncbi:palmitoyltransferase ZDHHC21-like [Clavelina lepadiformis]|uniref:Palmitoyltransferase n=1 Tax=Clavelina lepadiformis TaxID=159417 RepID=A0ABP0GG01_CLALP